MGLSSILKKIFLTVVILAVSIFLWRLFGFLGIFIFILYFVLAAIILCRGEKTSIPLFNEFIRNHYFNATFNMARIDNDRSKEGSNLKKQINFFINKLRFKIFYYAVLIFNNHKQSFEILREELQKKHKKNISITTENNGIEQIVNIDNLVDKIKKGQIQESDRKLINLLMDKLYELHVQKRKKIATFSLTGIIIIIVATTISNLLLSLILPIILKTK
ncbi:hypothetical protein ACFLZ0_03160 [Patescibacteria group bacterium]